MNTYRAEADALDAEILDAIHAWRVPNFDDLALRIFAHQLRYNEPYARYCASLGVTLEEMPERWDAIPPVPAGAFKEAALCTFDAAEAILKFETSGTTGAARGKHYLENNTLYDESLLSGFEALFLKSTQENYRFLLFVPQFSFDLGRQSSLGYMMNRAADCYSDEAAQWFIKGNTLFVPGFIRAVRAAVADRRRVIVAGTAFAFAALLHDLEQRAVTGLSLPLGSKIMETGGFKGRTRHVSRSELYRDLSLVFGIPESAIIAEYGMTELLSQYYDRSGDEEPRVKVAPPWLRSYAVDENGMKLPPGVVGALVHVDLANRSSCVAIQTEDLGAVFEDGGLVLLGRDELAELRGCSLDAELLRAR